MLYTTLQRAQHAVGIKATSPEAADTARLLALAASIGAALEGWCRRRFAIARETVTLPTYPGATVYHLPAAPIRTVHAVRFDASGIFASSDTPETITDYRIDGGVLVLDALPESRRGLQVDYTAGLVASFDRLGLTVTATGAIAVNAAVTCNGLSIGTVASYADGALVVTQTQGSVRAGDVLTIGDPAVSATVAAISAPCVLNDAPEIEQALLLQLTEAWHRRSQPGRSGTQAGQGGSINWADELKLSRMATELVQHLRRWA